MFLGSAELAAVTAILGRIPTAEEYDKYAAGIAFMSAEIYRYLSFDKIESYTEAAAKAELPTID